ncbi:MAG: aminotransferase class I/II-fold pyridoxal phosphate-dependent enzyme [Acidobacteria bacterium]|nr:aminotransferase class I/II-fold pyridoxal phosphate-dependent enzyme [Acidobacteriota bacterium]
MYDRPPEVSDGLRLHLNENTAGCSPRVLDALRGLTARDIGCYPGYEAAIRECAAYLGVSDDQVLLCNGLDEGLMALALVCLGPGAAAGGRPEAVIPEPAFELYRIYTDIAGGHVVAVPPRPDFRFALSEILEAITPRTRLVFLTNPNNPTGTRIARSEIHEVLARAPADATVFLDEAYADFSGETFLDELPRHPHLVIGRTFAKSHGLAGIRIGCLIGAASTLLPFRRVVPVYSVNAAAVAALGAALGDRAHVAWYVAQVEASKALMYDACDRLGLGYIVSAANFVLVKAGDRARALVDGLAARRIHVRDRGHQPGCAGCVRIATGVVDDTRRCVAAMEDVLCGDR